MEKIVTLWTGYNIDANEPTKAEQKLFNTSGSNFLGQLIVPYKWIYERSYIWTVEKDVKTWLIIAGYWSLKKIHTWTGFETMTSAIPVQWSTNWAMKPTGNWSHLSPQFRYMFFHIFTCILHHLRVYYELTMWPAPSWLNSSVGRALHRYRKGHGFESRSGLNFSRL